MKKLKKRKYKKKKKKKKNTKTAEHVYVNEWKKFVTKLF
jgi:hypothetical protein